MKFLASSWWATLAVVATLSALAIAAVIAFFGLRITGSTALYFIIWWTVLFAILPFGVRSQAEVGEVVAGSEPGAPTAPAMREKALWTTLVSAIVLMLVAGFLPLSGL